MKCAVFEEHSFSCVVYFRFSGTLFPVSMIDGVNRILGAHSSGESKRGSGGFPLLKLISYEK